MPGLSYGEATDKIWRTAQNQALDKNLQMLTQRGSVLGAVGKDQGVAAEVLPGIAARRGAGEVAEGADEVGVVGKSGQLPGLLHADPFLEQLAGPEHPAVNDVLHHRKAGGGFEDSAEIVLADEKFSGDLIQCEGFGQIVPNIVQNGGDPEKILVADGLSGGGGVEQGGHLDQKIQKGHGLVDVAAEAAVVFVALQSLKALNNTDHLLIGHPGPEERGVSDLSEVCLGSGQRGERFQTDVKHITGVKTGGDGAVQGIFPDQIKCSAAQGIDLVVDKNIARAGQGEQQFAVVVEMQAAHAPGVVVIELKVEIHIGHSEASYGCTV